MGDTGKRWTVRDRDGNPIYLTEERWSHILDNHPEIAPYEAEIRATLERGKRRQDALNPRKYRYVMYLRDLPDEFNHVVAIVLFGVLVDVQGESLPNNWLATAFMKHIRVQDKGK